MGKSFKERGGKWDKERYRRRVEIKLREERKEQAKRGSKTRERKG